MTIPFEHSEPVDEGVSLAPHEASGFTEVPENAIRLQFQDDRSVPMDRIPTDLPAPADQNTPQYSTGHKQFSTDNGNAFAVWERASHDWFGEFAVVSSTQNPVQLVGRTRGRKNITLYVPSTQYTSSGTTTPVGVLVSPNEGALFAGQGIQIPAGASLTISTEAPIWVWVLPGQTTGFVQYIEEVNISGGALGTFD